jgi:Flp pilus assembly protein RcpC/CpaB
MSERAQGSARSTSCAGAALAALMLAGCCPIAGSEASASSGSSTGAAAPGGSTSGTRAPPPPVAPSASIGPSIQKNFRALTLPLSTFHGTACAVRVGDHVDILFTYRDSQLTYQDQRRPDGGFATLTLLQNVLALSVTANDLTLLMLPEEAEMMAFGLASGELVVTQRRPDDIEAIPYPRTTLQTIETGDVVKQFQPHSKPAE